MGIIIERHGAAAVVILDWPEQRNALGPDRVREMIDAVKSAVDDESVAGLVLTGNGAFSAGGDVKGMATRVDMPAEERRKTVYSAYQGIITTLLDLPVPTVAAIDGAAVGFGLDIALACDSRFVGPNGFCMQGWARVGLVAGSGGILLMRMRAPGVLWRMLENQPRIDGPTAEQLGLAEAVIEGTARERAIARVNNYASVSRSALTAYCELDRALLKSLLPEHHAAVLDRQMPLLKSREHRDAVQQPGQ